MVWSEDLFWERDARWTGIGVWQIVTVGNEVAPCYAGVVDSPPNRNVVGPATNAPILVRSITLTASKTVLVPAGARLADPYCFCFWISAALARECLPALRR